MNSGVIFRLRTHLFVPTSRVDRPRSKQPITTGCWTPLSTPPYYSLSNPHRV
ncbi:hypothetical protein EYZ11_006559 [Aspergillus tanneri]|uniref:Uncharacterized protein n=1 Tax=Aspergillus tanneri TaxID=1220188 RepID=A0A4S3JHK8_9EURO|nr:hypothetical protein EYZ11_006559 [Aspergillus tanneri]